MFSCTCIGYDFKGWTASLAKFLEDSNGVGTFVVCVRDISVSFLTIGSILNIRSRTLSYRALRSERVSGIRHRRKEDFLII